MDPEVEAAWPLWDLVSEHWIKLDRIHDVTLDEVDMAHETLMEIRRAQARSAARAEAEYRARMAGAE